MSDREERIPLRSSEIVNFNIYAKVVKYQQKITFLQPCVKQNVLLRSNQRKGIDYDLLLTQQARRINSSIKQIGSYVCKHKHLWGTFSTSDKKGLKSIERKSKNKYINKFNWIHNTQFDQILKNKLINRKKRKKQKRQRKVQT